MMGEQSLDQSSTLPKGKVLVVDDEPQILVLVSRYLERMGYDVQTAAGGNEAIARLAEMPFALVLSDLKMPQVDGIQVLEHVRARYPDTIFVLMTAFGTIDSAVSVLRRGAYDYLTKPLELDDLFSTVRRALEHRAVVMQNKRLMEFLQEKNAVLAALHREEQRRSEQLNQVNAIARQITPILDVEALVETVVRLVTEAFQFASLSFGLIEGPEIVFRGGTLDGQREPAIDSAFLEQTEGGQRPFLASSQDADRAHDLVYPLRRGSHVIGFWVATWREDVAYREQNLPYLEALAAQTVTAVENARLYALARQVDELAFLNELGRAANQSLDLANTINSVLACVRATFNASSVEICLWDEEQAERQVYGLADGRYAEGELSTVGADLCRRMRRQPAVSCFGVGDQGAGEWDGEGAGSVLGVRLAFGERQIGCLGVCGEAPGAYDSEDARLLQVVGAQVSTAIENARLFAEVESGRQTILQSHHTLQALFDGILDGIYIVDRERSVLAINRTQARRAGCDLDALVGCTAAEAFPASKRSLDLIDRTFERGSPALGVERSREGEDKWTEWEIRTYPVFGTEDVSAANGRVDRVVVVVRDVTAERMLETSLARSEKLASVGRLAAGLAHEINNPMTVISANAQILREEIPATHPYYGSVELIEHATERASRIVRNMLDFSRAEQFELAEIDLNHSLEEAVLLVEPEIRRSNVVISLDLAPRLPPLWASADHLQVVWLNMLLNARDAIAEANRDGRIRVESALRDDHVVVRFSDNGIGIPEKEINRIYDPFFTTKPPGKGTGLGLFTCYRAVHRHGGEIRVSSRVGEGTTFEIAFPLNGRVGEEV